MNIQQVSRNPRKCARALDDIRLRKMVLEAAQVLCTVVNLRAGEQVTPYKNSHVHNPITQWAMKKTHWSWLWLWGDELGKEYIHRFGKPHASHQVILDLRKTHKFMMKNDPRPKYWHNSARHKQLGIDFHHIKDTRKAYKAYLNARWHLQSITPRKNGKIVPPVWTNRKAPKWCTL